MKKIFICLMIICGLFFSLRASAVAEKKAVVVFPLDARVHSASYAMYVNTQDMFAADLVNSLQHYKDLDVIDIRTAEKVMKIAGIEKEYEKLVKEYKQRYIIDYEKVDMIAQALGVNYIVFIRGGFDTEKAFMKPNWKYRCQWIWANPIKSSAQLNINVTLINADAHVYSLEENVKKDIPMDTFQQASTLFAENMVPISNIKSFTKTNADKISQKIHNTIYPIVQKKFSKTNAFIEKFIPNNNNNTGNDIEYYNTNTYNNYNYTPTAPEDAINAEQYINSTRRENYKNWVEQQF